LPFTPDYMKHLLTIPAINFPEFEELYVISDLHLGGTKGFQIFNAGASLGKLIDHLGRLAPEKRVALLINGDLVDFLAESQALPFDPIEAVLKLDRIVSDPAFAMVWQALQNFVSIPNRSLIINLGNHDLELALPWVRAHLMQLLSRKDPAAQGRITLAFEGTGYICRVGNAQILCVHGNEVDEWNLADYETIRRLGRDIMQGRPVESWIPNAGTQLVIQIMNGLKSRFPFIDLLKPEAQAVLPVLLALAPEQQDKLGAIAATTLRLLWDKLKVATGLLGREEEATQERTWLAPDFRTIDTSPAFSFPAGSAPARDNEQYAAVLLEETEKRLRDNVHPVSLIDQDLRSQSLGLPSALMKFIRGEDRREVLREALEQLHQDRSFDLKNEDETFKRLDDLIGDSFDFIISGHTHLERALPRRKKKGWYYNSGTWIRLIKLEAAVLKDEALFAQVFDAFKAGTMAALDNFNLPYPLVMRRLTVVAITTDGQGTKGKLMYVNQNTKGSLLTDVPESQSK
jgi:UDP-2,3-diacylglucosamine pyrophosphatase LpxH